MKEKLLKVLTTALLLSSLATLALGQVSTSSQSWLDVINNIIRGLQFLAGLVVVIFLIMGGFKFMTAGGNPDEVEKAKKDIFYAVVGLIIILVAQAFVSLANYLVSAR
jgi:hypothetical protein